MKNYFEDLISTVGSELMQTSVRQSAFSPVDVLELGAVGGLDSIMIGPALDLIKVALQCFTDYTMCMEHEQTERVRIAAQLEAINRNIDAKKSSVLEILRQNAQDRDKLYSQAEIVIKKALDLGDREMLTQAYSFMLNVYENSPSLESLKGIFEIT